MNRLNSAYIFRIKMNTKLYTVIACGNPALSYEILQKLVPKNYQHEHALYHEIFYLIFGGQFAFLYHIINCPIKIWQETFLHKYSLTFRLL